MIRLGWMIDHSKMISGKIMRMSHNSKSARGAPTKENDKTTTMSENIKQRRIEKKHFFKDGKHLSGTPFKKAMQIGNFDINCAKRCRLLIQSQSIRTTISNWPRCNQNQSEEFSFFHFAIPSQILFFITRSPQSLHDFLLPQTTQTILNVKTNLLVNE